MANTTAHNRFLSFVSLFGSLGTLLCCALPSLLVMLGLGAGVAWLVGSAPWLIALSRHKQWLFLGAGGLIAANFYYVYRLAPRLQARHGACPVHQVDESACQTASRLSRAVLWISAGIWGAGFLFTYVAGPALVRLQS
jgi:hypothetical protein